VKVVGIVGSPRRDGSTMLLVRKALEGAEAAGAETVLHHLGSMSFSGCMACYGCRDSGKCIRQDDMQKIYADLASAGAAVLGSPVYMFGPTSQTKAFADRLFALLAPGFRPRLGSGMPLLTIYTQGADGAGVFKPSFDALEGALDMIGLHPAGRITCAGVGEPSDLDGRPALVREVLEAGGRRVSAAQAGLQKSL